MIVFDWKYFMCMLVVEEFFCVVFVCNVCFLSEKGDKRGYYDIIENIL